MDFGIALTPDANAWRTVARAESLGFSHAWFYDTQLLCSDVLVAMTAAAMNTSRIVLGAGVLVPSNRLAPVAANALASLNALAPGRIVAGLGTGYTARRTMGLPAHRLADIREYARVMRALWAGDIVETDMEGRPRKLSFMHPESGFVNTDDPIPVHVSAFGPKARRMTAEIADGFINAWMSPASLDEAAEVRALRAEAGHDPSGLYATCFNLGCILEPGETADSPRARAEGGPFPAIGLHWMVEDGDRARVPSGLEPVVEAYRRIYETYEPADARYMRLHEGHLMYLRPDEERFVSADMIEALTLTGSPDTILERVAAMEAAGYDQVAVQLVPGHEDAIEGWAKLLMG